MALNVSNLISTLEDDIFNREQLEQTTFIGIDFGTSTTVVSYTIFSPDTKKLTTETIPIHLLLVI
ncbi:hypothetical protein [Crocosphaera sp.]|uniref:hypothetical protein n=1 Tax=Crocosphaera sp. TaxID=2729996 RepID=UPI003F1EC6A5|nr:hypothetical protein [Crocosphaera sp.]